MFNGLECYAVIAAGGRGTRFDAGQMSAPKQFAELCGRPIIAHTVGVFDRNPYIDGIIVVINSEYIGLCREVLAEQGFAKIKNVLPGGADRQESVFAGLSAIGNKNSLVAVHDAVRPLLTQSLLDECLESACKYGAVSAAVPVKETVKAATNGFIDYTPDRENLFYAQTPQAFKYGVIFGAHEKAAADGYKATDDAALAERLGIPVRIVAGSYDNIKITTAEDLRLAQALLSDRLL